MQRLDEEISLVRHGSETAWKELFDRHYSVLCQLAFEYVRDRFTAESIVSDVMFHLWEKRKDVQIQTSVRAYLVKSVRNRCLDYLKSYGVARVKSLSVMPDDFIEELLSDDPYPLGQILEMQETVEKAIAALPPECRAVFEKCKVEGLRYEEVANDLGISVNTVKYHMKRAISLLRDTLGKNLSVLIALIFIHQ